MVLIRSVARNNRKVNQVSEKESVFYDFMKKFNAISTPPQNLD